MEARGSRQIALGMAASLFLFGIYTNVGFLSGQSTFPAVSAIPGFLLLLPFFHKQLLKPKLYIALSLPLILLALTVFSPYTYGAYIKRLVAAGQTLYSVCLGLLLYAYVSSHSREQIARFLKFAIPIYIGLLALEVLTPLKNVVIAYMDIYQFKAYDYTVANRDLGMAGGHRPKFFTSETSYVAMTLTFAIGLYAWTMKGRAKYIIALLYSAVGLIVVRSPILMAAPLLVAVDYGAQAWKDMALRRFSLVAFPLVSIVAALSFSGVLNFAQPYFEPRLRGIKSGDDYSTTYRTYGSYAAGIAVANEYPISGVGFGTQEIAAPIVQAVFVSYGVPIIAVAKDWRISLANAFAYSLIIFGYAGSLVVLFLALLWTRNVAGALDPVFLGLVLTLSLTFGAVYTPKYVCHWMIFAGVGHAVAASRRRGKVNPQRPAVVVRQQPPRPLPNVAT